MALPKNLGELLGANEAAAAAFDEKLFAAELTDGLAQKVVPALQPLLLGFVDYALRSMPEAVGATVRPLLADVLDEVRALRAEVRALRGLKITIDRGPEV
jgi:hypothetical protein